MIEDPDERDDQTKADTEADEPDFDWPPQPEPGRDRAREWAGVDTY